MTLDDETLRDGLQNPSVQDPSIDEKIEILHLMEALGIETVNIGLPGAGPRAYADTEALAREIVHAHTEDSDRIAPREPTKTIFGLSSKFRKKSDLNSKPPLSWVPARFAVWSKIGPSIISSASPKKP